MYNYSAAEERERKLKVHRLSVTYKGRVRWKFPSTLVSSCSLDVTRWPMDTQECTLMFASSAYTKRRMQITGVNKTHKGKKNTTIRKVKKTLKVIGNFLKCKNLANLTQKLSSRSNHFETKISDLKISRVHVCKEMLFKIQ